MGQACGKTGPSVFLCHTGEDKDRFVEPLHKALVANGLKPGDIFYDKFSIQAGHEIKQSIESAIANPNLQLVVIVLSRNLLCEHKYWPKREFELALQKYGSQKFFPIWLDYDFRDFDTLVRNYSPTLKGTRALPVTYDSQTGIVEDTIIQDVAENIISKLQKAPKRCNKGYGVLAVVAVIAVVIAVILQFTKEDPGISETASFLKTLYVRRYSYIQPLPWKPGLRLGLADGYINLRLQRESDRGLFNTPAEVVTTSELFNSHKKSHKGKPNRIMVEGEPGGGKSTLCRKVVIDWVGDRITGFTLIFLLELRRFKGSVMDSIYDQLLGDNLDIGKEELKEYIKHHQGKVCFILDGFDELNMKYQKESEILQLTKGKIFYGSTVLVTSRPLQLRETLKDSDAFYKIVGFRQDQKDEIFRKYFINDSMSANELSAIVSKNKYLEKITENPLNTVLICVLWEDNRQGLPETKTELYGEMVKSITRRYCDKFDIKCDGKSFPANIEMLLLSQGKLAWEGSETNRFHFDIDDMGGEDNRTEMLSLGMMVQGETVSRTSGYTYVAFLHPTLQEFMAAYYIHEMLYKEGALTTEILQTIVQREDLEGILIFLCGLSGDQARPLLEGFNDAIDENVTTTTNDVYLKRSKSLVRRCLTCLGATNVGAKLAGIVAPAMPEEVVLDFDYLTVEWIEGFTAFVQFIQESSDDTLQKTFRSLVLASIHGALGIPRDILVRIRSVLKRTTVVESVKMFGWSIPLLSTADNTVLRSPLSEFFSDDSLKKVKITVHAARAIGFSHINYITLSGILEDLRKKRNVNAISISVFSATATSYCDAISRLLQSQTSLKSFTLDVSLLSFYNDTQGYQGFHDVLDVIKNHQSLHSVTLKQPAEAILSERTHNVSTLLISIAQFIRENRILKSFHLHMWDCTSPCSRFALMELSEAIRSNHILEELMIVGIPLENESDQNVVDDIMRNKPSTMRTLELLMHTGSSLLEMLNINYI